MPQLIQSERKEYQRLYRLAHLEKEKLHHLSYRAAHTQEIKEYQKNYNESNFDKIKAQKHDYYIKHLEELKICMKEYRQNHADTIKTVKANYYKGHADEIKVTRDRYNNRTTIDIVCTQCGNAARVSRFVSGKFCSRKCRDKFYSGPNCPQWKGGISTWPYCPKFNDELKELVRTDFGRRCFLSGVLESNPRHDVHHCDYLKSQGCQGQRWSLLPLAHSWHAKTNHNRWYWFALLRDYWVYKYLIFHGMDIFEGPDRTTWLWEMYNNGSN